MMKKLLLVLLFAIVGSLFFGSVAYSCPPIEPPIKEFELPEPPFNPSIDISQDWEG